MHQSPPAIDRLPSFSFLCFYVKKAIDHRSFDFGVMHQSPPYIAKGDVKIDRLKTAGF